MKEKITAILGSLRFWLITFGAASAFAAFVEQHGFKLSDLLNAITIYLGTVAGVGTVDKIAKSLGGKPTEPVEATPPPSLE